VSYVERANPMAAVESNPPGTTTLSERPYKSLKDKVEFYVRMSKFWRLFAGVWSKPLVKNDHGPGTALFRPYSILSYVRHIL